MPRQNISNKQLGKIFIFSALLSFKFKRPSLIVIGGSYAIASNVLRASTLFFTHKAIFVTHKNYSGFANFVNATFETLILQQCKTIQERISYLAIQSIPNAYFFLDQSPIAFAHPNLSYFYNIPKAFVTNTCLLYPSLYEFLFIRCKEANIEWSNNKMKEACKKKSPDKSDEEIQQILDEQYQALKNKENQCGLLLQSIKTAYFLSRISGLLKTPFPDAYALLPTHIKQWCTQRGTMKSRLVGLLLGILQDVAYVCFIRSIVYPSVEKIHDHLIHPIQQYLLKKYSEISHKEINLAKPPINRLLCYITSGMIMFYASDKVLQLLYQKGIICMQNSVHV
jgi:hypothetical protein